MPHSPVTELTIVHAAEQREAWLAAMAASDAALPMQLDLSAVGDVDSAGLQLLLSLRHSLAAQGRALHLAGASATLHNALHTLGLADLLPAATAA